MRVVHIDPHGGENGQSTTVETLIQSYEIVPGGALVASVMSGRGNYAVPKTVVFGPAFWIRVE